MCFATTRTKKKKKKGQNAFNKHVPKHTRKHYITNNKTFHRPQTFNLLQIPLLYSYKNNAQWLSDPVDRSPQPRGQPMPHDVVHHAHAIVHKLIKRAAPVKPRGCLHLNAASLQRQFSHARQSLSLRLRVAVRQHEHLARLTACINSRRERHVCCSAVGGGLHLKEKHKNGKNEYDSNNYE